MTRAAAHLASVCGIAMVFAAGARAQSVAEPVAAPAAASDGSEIVVTAQRRSERLENVPATVAAISAGQLQASGVTKFMDIGQLNAGVQIQKNGYTTQPAIRGISTLTSGYGFENNVATYIDGFYQPDSVAINGDLVNLNDVEILKGPQGTLYGRNATGGAILINTLTPSDTFTGLVRIGYAQLNDRMVQAYASGPIAKDVSFGVAGSYHRTDGYIRDIATGSDVTPTKNDSIRAKLKLTPSDWATITVGYNYAKVLDAIGLAYTIYAHPLPSLPVPPARATARDTASNNIRPDNTAELNEGTLAAEFRTGIGMLTLRTSYGDRKTRVAYDFDGSYADVFRGVIPAEQKTFQQAADYTVNLVPNLDLLVGGLYYHDRIRINGQQAFINGALTTTDYTRLGGDAISGYIDGTYHIGKLSLTAGVRYSHEHKTVAYAQVAARPVPDGANSANFSAATPRVIARYEIAPRTNIYASFSQGFRSGVFQNQVLPNPALVQPIKPERITAYEAGIKFARRFVQFDLAGFYYDYSQLQVGVTVPNPITGVGVISTIINAKAAQVYGLDAQVTLRPMEGLHVAASGSLLHAHYTDFANATATGFNATTGSNVSNQARDWSGHQMARAPSSSATLQVDYTFDFLRGRLQAAFNGTYTASYVVSNPSLYGSLAGAGLADKQRFRQGAYALGNIQLNWTDISKHWTLTAYLTNFTDRRYYLVTSGGAYGDYRQFNQPRTLGGKIAYQF